MIITPVYAALTALLFVALGFRVIGARREARIGLGDGGNRILLRRIRAHGNFAEYAPMALILMALIELQAASSMVMHAMGVCLLTGRLIHAYGVSVEPENVRLRVTGMILTFSAILIGAFANLRFAVFGGAFLSG
jgi:uncharacterized membrane protein YecN with MAPEG domain